MGRIFVVKMGGKLGKEGGWFVWSCSEDRKFKLNIVIIV